MHACMYASYSYRTIYRDHEGMKFPESNLSLTTQLNFTLLVYWLGITDPKKINPNPFQKVATEF